MSDLWYRIFCVCDTNRISWCPCAHLSIVLWLRQYNKVRAHSTLSVKKCAASCQSGGSCFSLSTQGPWLFTKCRDLPSPGPWPHFSARTWLPAVRPEVLSRKETRCWQPWSLAQHIPHSGTRKWCPCSLRDNATGSSIPKPASGFLFTPDIRSGKMRDTTNLIWIAEWCSVSSEILRG